jgi:hypothetical protein
MVPGGFRPIADLVHENSEKIPIDRTGHLGGYWQTLAKTGREEDPRFRRRIPHGGISIK